jgi:hypothetical protein
MKRISIVLFAFFLAINFASAQDGKKMAKEASKALAAFNIAGGNDADKLKEAIAAADQSVKDAEYGKLSKTWITRGEIYNAVVNLFTTQQFTATEENPAVMMDKNAPQKAYESFMKALEFAEKNWETRDALKGLSESVVNLNNSGFTAYEAGDYAGAYDNFSKVMMIHNTLKENGEKSGLDDESAYNDQAYTTGLAALNSNNMEAAGKLFSELEARNFDQPTMYDALYKVNREDDIEKALGYLNKGREKYPNDVTLLFTEINHYLTAGEMDVLETRLQEAISKEPDNAALYYTLARVYGDVSDARKEEGDQAASDEYFEKSVAQYSMALEKKPDYYEAMYGIGEGYYNRAAIVSTQMQDLGMSKEDQKLYAELDEEMKTLFDKALPYFKEAEKLNPNDNNTLVALSEIYARKNEFDKVTEFKNRLKTVQEGGKNESYFSNND